MSYRPMMGNCAGWCAFLRSFLGGVPWCQISIVWSAAPYATTTLISDLWEFNVHLAMVKLMWWIIASISLSLYLVGCNLAVNSQMTPDALGAAYKIVANQQKRKCIYNYSYVCTYLKITIHTHTYIYNTYVHEYLNVHLYILLFIYVCNCIYIYIFLNMYIYIY